MANEKAMEPEFAAFLDAVRRMPDFDPFSVTPGDAAARLRAPLLPKPAQPHPEVTIEDDVVEHSGLRVPVRVYAPKNSPARAAVLNLHGGGFVVGSVSMDDHRCAEIAKRTGCVVISVEYRLAPEHPFPAALDDCYAVLEWAAGPNHRLPGIGRLGIVGSSAGGSLAVAVALASRDRNGPTISAQVLLYPMTDNRLQQSSYRTYGSGYYLTARDIRWYYDQYIGTGVSVDTGYAAPLRAGSLANLPPSLVITAEFDPLRDEAEELASRLQADGNRTILARYGGAVHGFVSISPTAQASRLALTQSVDFLNSALA